MALDLDGALHVDLEDDKAAALELLEDPGLWCAVLLTVDAGGLDELAGGLHALELIVRDEVVVDALDIGGSLGTGGAGDGEGRAGDGAFDAAGDGCLADAGGARDDEQEAVIGVGDQAVFIGGGGSHRGRVYCGRRLEHLSNELDFLRPYRGDACRAPVHHGFRFAPPVATTRRPSGPESNCWFDGVPCHAVSCHVRHERAP